MEIPTGTDMATMIDLGWKPVLHGAKIAETVSSRLSRRGKRRRSKGPPYSCKCADEGIGFLNCGIEDGCICDWHCRDVARLEADILESERREAEEYDWYVNSA